MDKSILYFTVKLTALAVVTAYDILADAVSSFYTAIALTFCCLFLIDLLISRVRCNKSFFVSCICIQIGGCFVWGTGRYFTVMLMLIFEFIDFLEADGYFYYLSASSALLAFFIFSPSFSSAITAFTLICVGVFARTLTGKLVYYKELSERQSGTISEQKEEISKLKAYSATLRSSVAIEERSRFSTRIHDKLGHGISGSIILLEGVKMNIQNKPEEAEKYLDIAIKNLHDSVDSIREVLREERPKRHIAGIAECKEMLEQFSLIYGIRVDFLSEGDTEKITPQIWSCLKENLTESMTNTIKHSDAKVFAFHIFIYNKMVRAEFSDDGSAAAEFSKGIGLDAIEERTVACGGTCLFQNTDAGFTVINIFRL